MIYIVLASRLAGVKKIFVSVQNVIWTSNKLDLFKIKIVFQIFNLLKVFFVPASKSILDSMINLNIINSAHENGCKKIVFLGASCMYPKFGKQPFKEDSILDGKIEETNEGYGISKIIGLKFIEMLNNQYKSSHLSIIPAASYGTNDCYDDSKNHVIPALIKKFPR